jgi:hypothetical protein
MNLKKELEKIMDNLDYAFVSEGDFQFILATKLKEKLGTNSIIVEYPLCNKYIDITVVDKNTQQISFIELKYNTKKDTIIRNGIKHTFKNTGTHIIDFICDITKLQNIKNFVKKETNLQNNNNYCILLTNNNSDLKTGQKIKNTDYTCKWKKCNKIKTQTNKTKFQYLLVEIN